MWNALALVTAPALKPVSLAEVKAQCYVDHTDDDALLTAMINSAVAMIDGPDGIGHCMIAQTWKLALDYWCSPIVLPLSPVASVTDIKYLDSDGAEQTLNSALYRLVNSVQPAFIERAYGASWPAHRAVSYPITVRFVTGVATAAEVDAGLRAALLLIVGHLYKNREATVEAPGLVDAPFAARELIERHRAGRFA